jgi:riboflavin synthase
MFTGLVEFVGEVLGVDAIRGGGRRLSMSHGLSGEPLVLGESVAVDGACLTVVARSEPTAEQLGRFEAELSPETLRRTTLGQLVQGSRVNLERSLRMGDRLGGHLVTGHVDGVGHVTDVIAQGEMTELLVQVPTELAPFIAEKGSVTLAGVSLTVNRVDGAVLAVQLIPHTRAVTTLGEVVPSSRLNVEVDLIARYVQRLVTAPR